VTERYAKPVLPIDGVPVVASLVRELAGCCARVTVVVGHRELPPRRFGGLWWLGRDVSADDGMGPEPLSLRPLQLARVRRQGGDLFLPLGLPHRRQTALPAELVRRIELAAAVRANHLHSHFSHTLLAFLSRAGIVLRLGLRLKPA